MEGKLEGCEEGKKVESSRVSVNGDDEGNLSVLKREIACHSLYGHLVDSHLDCLKLCLGEKMENIEDVIFNPISAPQLNHSPNLSTADQSELDQFMEAYCALLKKVKEVIEEPQQESMAFINYVYSQLEDLLHSDAPSSSL
ncbi:homeobox protein knotted-1-like 1 [Striga asiatica]|uniref:Homeobox protein knotted-1-like 1 n=1 Tax=Striga asiatica TaxID=4170 RepID=A0A5A7R9P1_STRAF|nr:homeobox protein knotted-1-like 1 [Striga asiatica]